MNNAKAVPIVLRGSGNSIELLVFEHPVAGVQLIKGTIEQGESATEAALRELTEESGVVGTRVLRSLGAWSSNFHGQVWHLEVVEAIPGLPETWTHFTKDGGGLLFRFFWHPLYGAASTTWHQVYRAALNEVARRLAVQPCSAPN